MPGTGAGEGARPAGSAPAASAARQELHRISTPGPKRFAPHGTGFLWVRRDRIPEIWPLMAAPDEMRTDIRKFEEIGTHPEANFLAIAEALTFHQLLGSKRKEARMVHLRDYWARRPLELDRVRLHTSLKPGFACGMATVEVEGVEPVALNE